MLKGQHLISGEWIGSERVFQSCLADDQSIDFACGSVELVEQAVNSAETAFLNYGYSDRRDRSAFLNKIADNIDALGAEITRVGVLETALPAARLDAERGRTVSQLRYFASVIEEDDYLDLRHDAAIPDRLPLPRADLRMMQRPLGPVAVFGASNFPLAFSVAGGDTASALAAGCSVVVKGHPAHPGTGELVAQAIDLAIKESNVHPGVFSLIQDGPESGNTVGASLVTHPLVRAVGFTGSLRGGRALFNLCSSRPDPIPFFGELGSTNPVFVFPGALAENKLTIAKGWTESLIMGVGQFCTKPGIIVVEKGSYADEFVAEATNVLKGTESQAMLTEGICNSFQQGVNTLNLIKGVHQISGKPAKKSRHATPSLFLTDVDTLQSNPEIIKEVFGPSGIIVKADSKEQFRSIAERLPGQLTCTVHASDSDIEACRQLLPILERKAGRILANSYPTGVEVCDSMVHGGPFPASTNFGATSVGSLSIRRFLRPVCYQNLPVELLPAELC